jgi:hypothetical protein
LTGHLAGFGEKVLLVLQISLNWTDVISKEK